MCTYIKEQEILKFYLQPNTGGITCKKFNITRYELKKILLKNNIKPHSRSLSKQIKVKNLIKNLSTENIDLIYNLYLNKNSLKAISNKFNISKYIIKLILKEKNIIYESIANKNFSIANSLKIEIIQAYTIEQESLLNISKKLHVSIQNIKKILQLNNIPLRTREEANKIGHEHSKETCLKKYSSECFAGTAEWKEKAKQTNLEKYGVENPFQVEAFKEKIKQTNLERYGVENIGQSDYYNKICDERYGKDRLLKNGILRTKMEKTCLEKSGLTITEKTKLTCQQKYGTNSFSQSKEYKNILFEHYGMYHAPRKVYNYDLEYFDSFPELCFYLFYIKNNIPIRREPIELLFEFDNKQYHYYPDFEVNNQLYEIKGDQFLKEDGSWQNPFGHSLDALFESKHQCALQNHVIILYKEDYQKYIDWFYQNNYKKEDFIVKE